MLPLAAALATMLLGATAHAHGGVYRGFDVAIAPDDPGHVLVRSDVWGIIETRDGGESWAWTCAEAHGGASETYQRLSLAVAPGGAVLLGANFGGVKVSRGADLCQFDTAPEFQGDEAAGIPDKLVTDVELGGGDGSSLFAVSYMNTPALQESLLWRSTDGAESWEIVGDPLPSDASGEAFFAESMKSAPSNADRLYVAGKFPSNLSAVAVLRSDDGGLSYEVSSFESAVTTWSARVAGVHPTNPDVVFVWVDQQDAQDTPKPDELWMSADAGAAWQIVYTSAGDLPGFAISPDGSRVALSGPVDGLSTFGVSADGAPGAVTLRSDAPFWGLEWTADGLFAGGDDFAASEPRFTLGVSHDDGATFEHVFDVCEVTLGTCADGTSAGDVCADHFSQPVIGGFREDFQLTPRCAGASSGPDGGTETPPASDAGRVGGGPRLQGTDEAGGCGCVVGRGRRHGAFGAALSALLALWAARRGRPEARGTRRDGTG